MSYLFFILMLVAMGSVLASLFIGLFFMTRGGDENRQKSNKWMQARVTLQGIAILMFALAVLTSK